MLKNRIFLLVAGIFICSALKGEIVFPKVRGWSMDDSIRVYQAETLWEYINGAAESYLNYDFRQLQVMEYARSPEEYIKAEVYDQGSGMNAFGIYAFERPEEAQFLELGCEGYRVHSSLNFYTEEYYVKIHSHQTDAKTLTAIRTIAEKIALAISEKPEKPLLLDLIPDYEKIPRSEKYFSSNFLGYSFLNNAIVADYLSKGERYRMFLLVNDNTEDALSVLQSYLKQSKSDREPREEEIYDINDIFNGYVALAVTDRYLAGVIDLNDRELANEYLAQFIDYILQSKP